ncbi:unnamed protein product [Caenorhabditis auriculariae]|uniref:Cadherin domain-containing protein n=1 Tax=Caenorhabditis auriculariae TaxID=2777116 RepID=A0A8S1GXL4_9PELO|nr:unnamed protein product [Caenorhabditis auriculariae]
MSERARDFQVSANNSRCGGSKRLRYSIQDGAILNIDSISGTVCVEKSFDYETQTTFQTNVIASNSGGESSTALVSIRVTDVNDNAPVFYPQIYNISAREGELSDSALLVVSAVDADRGVFGQVRYALMSDSATFYINISSGELFAKRRLPRGKYHLIISAVDGGGLHAEIAAHVHILVISSDAVAPVFTQLKYVIRTTEDILPGIVIGSVAAVAPNPVRYSTTGRG